MSGIRSMSAPAMLAIDARHNNRKLEGTPFELLKRPEAPLVVGLMSVGEMLADQLPFIPNRTDPGPLFGRIVIGGTSAAIVFTGEGKPAVQGAVLGAAAAVISTFASYNVRKFLSERAHLPNVLGGLLGDAVVIALGAALLRVGKVEVSVDD